MVSNFRREILEGKSPRSKVILDIIYNIGFKGLFIHVPLAQQGSALCYLFLAALREVCGSSPARLGSFFTFFLPRLSSAGPGICLLMLWAALLGTNGELRFAVIAFFVREYNPPTNTTHPNTICG